MSNQQSNRLQYDQEFIDKVLNGEIDSYGENSPVDITIDAISNGRDSYYETNEESINELLHLLNNQQ